MNKNVLIIGAVGLAAAAYLYLGQGASLSSGGGGGPSGGPTESNTKKDDSAGDGGGGGTTFVFPADTFTGFPNPSGPSLEDLLKLLTPPPVATGGGNTTKKDVTTDLNSRIVSLGAPYPRTEKSADGGVLQGFLDFFGSGEILRQATGTSSSNALAGKGGTSGGGFGGFGGFGAPVGAALSKGTGASPLNKKDEGMAINSGAGTGAYTLVDPFYSTDRNVPVTSASSVYNIAASGKGTVLASGNIVVPQAGVGKGAGVVLLSPTGQFLAGGSAGATPAALEKTAGMEAAAQAATRSSQIASGYFVNSKGGLQKGGSSKGGKK